MANRTSKDAASVKGTNPQYLVEKIIRTRIYDSLYWKEQCFGLSAEMIVDRGMELRYIGGIYGGNIKTSPFLCLTLKLLQLQPDKDIIVEFIRQDDFKYLRALGAMYIRLTCPAIEVYKYLEPLYNDYRKLRYMDRMGKFKVIFMDDFIDALLRETSSCDIQLPFLQKRQALEETDQLELYSSALDEDLDNLSTDSEEERERERKKEKPRLVSRRRSRSNSRGRERSRSRERDRHDTRSSSRRDERDRRDDREREREKDRDRPSGSGSGSRSSGKDRDRGSNRDDEEREIEESNALRAKLGLAPLKR